MAKRRPKAKAKAKAKPKPKAKAKPKPKAKPKSKAKPKAKAKPKPKPKPKPKARPKPKPTNLPGPGTVYPQMCNSFTANTGETVDWQSIPPGGCEIEQSGPWPFNVGPPIFLPAPYTIQIAVGRGQYQIVVKCCLNEAMKTVTVP